MREGGWGPGKHGVPVGGIFCASRLHIAVSANGKSQSLFIVDYSNKNKLTIYNAIDTI